MPPDAYFLIIRSNSNPSQQASTIVIRRFINVQQSRAIPHQPTLERPRLADASVLVAVDAVDGAVELVPEAEVGYPLTSLDEIRIKRPLLEPLACRLKAIAVNLHGNSFRLGVNNERGRNAALGEVRMDVRGKSAALKMKTLHSYPEVPRYFNNSNSRHIDAFVPSADGRRD